ncbi:hypothetical protein PS6_008173 [Mucor atramentarius]
MKIKTNEGTFWYTITINNKIYETYIVVPIPCVFKHVIFGDNLRTKNEDWYIIEGALATPTTTASMKL